MLNLSLAEYVDTVNLIHAGSKTCPSGESLTNLNVSGFMFNVAATEELAERPVVFGIDMAKQPMLGWQLNLFFEGYGPSAEFLVMILLGGGPAFRSAIG